MTKPDLNTNLRQAFFNNAQESFAIFDKDLYFIDVNESLLNTLGFKREQIVGKHLCEISPGINLTDRYKLYQQVIRTGKPIVIDEVRMHPSLGNFVTRISIFKVGDGLGLGALNVTDLKDAIDELETFSYRSAHDMRSPIANILGLIDMADMEVKDVNDAKNFFGTIKAQVQRLDLILQKLVETARIRQGDKTIYLIDFNELIVDILDSLKFMPGFDKIRMELNIASNNKFYSDKSLIISLLQNLIDNAIKYRNENSADSFIKIEVTDEADGVKITISDNGIGIRESLQKDVFNIFFRATNQSVGTGLGLYTVKHCVKKLGGHVRLDSQEHKYTTFTVHLPNEKRFEHQG